MSRKQITEVFQKTMLFKKKRNFFPNAAFHSARNSAMVRFQSETNIYGSFQRQYFLRISLSWNKKSLEIGYQMKVACLPFSSSVVSEMDAGI